jgi:hypothetical protein
VQLKELKANSSISQEASDISEQVHDCCQQQTLLVDLSEDLSACYFRLCLLSQALPAIPNFGCYPKLCLSSQILCALPAHQNFVCYPKLGLLSQTLPAVPDFVSGSWFNKAV